MTAASKFIVALAAAVTLYGNCHAGSLSCSGTVEKLVYHQPGNLMIQLSSMNAPVFICNTDSEWVVPGSLSGNTTVSACKTIYATFLAAKTTRTPLSNLLFDGDQVPASCTGFTNWLRANVRYYEF